MIFVDSSAWFAVYSQRDVNHDSAVKTLQALRQELVTSDFIIDETLTLLRVRDQHRHAVAFGRRLIEANAARVVTIGHADFLAAWKMFRGYQDKEWSFTDCTSFVVMKERRLRAALTGDRHFAQAGFEIVP